jgi:hypothetical protein
MWTTHRAQNKRTRISSYVKFAILDTLTYMDRHTHNSFLGMITLCMVTLTAVVFVATRLHGVVLEPLVSDQVVTRIAQVAAVADFDGSLSRATNFHLFRDFATCRYQKVVSFCLT